MKLLIVIILLWGHVVWAGDTERALGKVAEALYEYEDVKETVKRVEKKYVPKPVKEYGPWIIRIVEITEKETISYTWTF